MTRKRRACASHKTGGRSQNYPRWYRRLADMPVPNLDTVRPGHANKAVEAGVHTSFIHSSKKPPFECYIRETVRRKPVSLTAVPPTKTFPPASEECTLRTQADTTGLFSFPPITSYMFSHVSLMGNVRLTADKREQDGISKERNSQRLQRSVLVSPEFLSRLSINSCVGLMFNR